VARRALDACLVAELTVIDPRGRLVTHPLIPLFDGHKVYMHSSVLFSRKLEHIAGNPKVAVSITDPVACPGLEPFRRVTIQGDARVIEDDVHHGWERLVLDLWAAKEPLIRQFVAQRYAMPLFWERAVIEISPQRALIWDEDTSRPPTVYDLRDGKEAEHAD
jgi:nitroimidazol reductase NimA-like FMN-containing flavoprotein (pyridoxamine 5'-phosphate oxidase superfamily)